MPKTSTKPNSSEKKLNVSGVRDIILSFYINVFKFQRKNAQSLFKDKTINVMNVNMSLMIHFILITYVHFAQEVLTR